jgi:ribonuclease HI
MTAMVYGIFTDGSYKRSSNNLSDEDGFAVVIPTNESELVYYVHGSYRSGVLSSSSKCELFAILVAMVCLVSMSKRGYISRGDEFVIYTDSDYCFNSLTTYTQSWESNGWRKTDGTSILNQDLIRTILNQNSLLARIDVKCHMNKVAAHGSDKRPRVSAFNKIADTLAARRSETVVSNMTLMEDAVEESRRLIDAYNNTT